LVGENVNEVLSYSIDEGEVWKKRWASAFRTLLKDAIKDDVDLEVIVIRRSRLHRRCLPSKC
jgi:hypothetical protein